MKNTIEGERLIRLLERPKEWQMYTCIHSGQVGIWHCSSGLNLKVQGLFGGTWGFCKVLISKSRLSPTSSIFNRKDSRTIIKLFKKIVRDAKAAIIETNLEPIRNALKVYASNNESSECSQNTNVN